MEQFQRGSIMTLNQTSSNEPYDPLFGSFNSSNNRSPTLWLINLQIIKLGIGNASGQGYVKNNNS